jgi:hypothetical protein
MWEWILPDVQATNLHTKRITNLLEQSQTKSWKLETHDTMFEAQKVLLCTGSTPKTMDLGKPTLPLSLCLSPTQLYTHIDPSDAIVVFGTAHSGTLVLRNLNERGCKDVVAIYRTTPFAYARDGHRRGIKQESARIADQIANGAWGDSTPTLLPADDFAKVYRAVQRANYVLYTFGFQEQSPHYTDTTGHTHSMQFEAQTSTFADVPNVWGFGMAFPSHIPGTHLPDIGFQGFIRAIQNVLPAILA